MPAGILLGRLTEDVTLVRFSKFSTSYCLIDSGFLLGMKSYSAVSPVIFDLYHRKHVFRKIMG